MRKGRRFYFNWPMLVLIPALALLGAVAGYTWSRWTDNRVVSGVHVGRIALGRLHAREAVVVLETAFASILQHPVSIVQEERSWSVIPYTIGLRPDYEATVARALLVGRRGGILASMRQRREAGQTGVGLPLTFRLDSELWDEFCASVEEAVNRDPVSAHITVKASGEMSTAPSETGTRLDRARLLASLKRGLAMEQARSYRLPVVAVAPELTEKKIANWPLDQVLGVYSTKFNAADTTRAHNLCMAAARLDGLAIGSGEDFSFNKAVGPRIPDKGYLEAPVVLKNQLVLGVGGGVCQVSSTLFNAVLLADLPIRQRSNHSLLSAYVPLGRDATVVYDAVDLVFGNDIGRPVLIVAGVTGARLTVAIVGHRRIAPKVSLMVEVKEIVPNTTVTENDPGLAAGTAAVAQEGKKGYKVQLWRIASWPDGRSKREPICGICSYPPVVEVIKRGIGSPRFSNSMSSASPESISSSTGSSR